MAGRFTLGIEEEFQLVDRRSFQLCSCIKSVLEKGAPYFEEKIKPELTQSTVELISDICPDIATARKDLYTLRALMAKLADRDGLALVSAGTHPSSSWQDQDTTEKERYAELEEEFQDLIRSNVIFGMHVHVGVEDKELAIKLMNQARTWLPHLLAISTNSPFWSGRYTGIKSYRSALFKRIPRTGMPGILTSWNDFDRYVQDLVEMGCIDNGKKIWWDMRPHPFFDTVEFRICDMPATIEDTLALAALCQALIAKLTWCHEHNVDVPVLKRDYLEENKWRAMRYGLEAEAIDFVKLRRLGMRDSINELLDFVEDVVDDLGSRHEMNYLRALMVSPNGTGADRQAAVYEQTGDLQKVVELLMEQTMQGITLDAADLSHEFLKFKMYDKHAGSEQK
ncbi:MAG TPA: carboxylate-amine ligase [Ktedonobacteraceae bacterium]|nr:carboxylate-amine ligase [Ktedonobacteraceae bacterium]